MKVLMFGWEFPPRISGGLGTACFGLTQSLVKVGVKVLFVVPRLFGGENGKKVRLVSASEVQAETTARVHHRKERAEGRRPPATRQKSFATHGLSGMTYIEAPSGLSPYKAVHTGSSHGHSLPLSDWNYSFAANGNEKTSDAEIRQAYPEEDRAEAEPFTFSGTYGDKLMAEVRHYGTVGGILAKKYKFDVIHVHDWMTFLAGITARRLTRKPLVVHVHSTEADRSGDHVNRDILAIEKLGWLEADLVIAVSNWTRDILVSKYGVPAEKVKVVHNGITPREQKEEFPFPDFASHFVTFLGRVTHQKGPRFFVEAARNVLQEFPDAHFIVAGAGDLLPQMIERVAQLNMSSSFHFTGFLSGSQVDQIWSLTDVYVMPSVSEPFGIAPLEAIQGGVPVILSNQSGVSEVMPHAIKVDFWDVKALSAAICSVLRYESLSQELKQNSKRHIQHLTWDKAASSVKALYHELLTKR